MRVPPKRSIGPLLLAAPLAVVLAACSTHPARHASPHDLRLARAFKVTTVYWAGPAVAGVPLTAVDDGYDYDPTIGMRVYYGDCAKHGSVLSTGRCTLPVEVTTVIYEPHANSGLGPHAMIRIRGVPAAVSDGGRAIELYTGHLAIDVHADTPARAIAVASALRPLNATGSQRDNLPPPQYRPGAADDPRAKAIATELRAQPTEPTTAAPQLLPRSR